MKVPRTEDVSLAPFAAWANGSTSQLADGTTAADVGPVLRSETSVRDVVAEALERIHAGQHLRAFITVTAERALARAADLDARFMHSGPVGSLHGVTLAVKDCIDVAGVATTCGTWGDVRPMPTVSAPSVAALERAGAVVIGKTSLHEWAYGATSDNPWFGRVRNPEDVGRTPGGSSGGSAVAVATGMAQLALGTDTGGSVRIPASYCGVAGLKATPGRISVEGVEPLSWTLDTVGILAARIPGLSAAFRVLSSKDAGRAGERGVPERPRLGVLVGGPFDAGWVQPAVTGAVAQALDVFADQGARLQDCRIQEFASVRSAFFPIVLAEASALHGGTRRADRSRYGTDIQAALAQGDRVSAADYIDALRWRWVLREVVEGHLRDVDAIIAPVVPQVAPLHEVDEVRWPDGTSEPAIEAAARLCLPASLAGLPAVALPLPRREGLPVGLQLIGGAGNETDLLKLAGWMERVLSGAARS